MSLRVRLLVVLVVLAAAGLVTAGAVTYASERSLLNSQINTQLTGNTARDLENLLDATLGLRHRGLPQGSFPDRQGFEFGAGQTTSETGLLLPQGTYGIYVNPNGTYRAYVQTPKISTPKLPKHIPLTTNLDHPKLITVGSVSGSSRYRVLEKKSDAGPGELIIAVPLNGVTSTLNRLRDTELLVIAAVLLVLIGVAWLLIRIGLRPLDKMGATAGMIAAGDLSRRVTPAEERTEVGRLGLALNAMLGQIERAFRQRQASEDRLRRFLSDASHELRTPLTSIRGYAELFRIGAASNPADAAKAMARIEEEATRMGVLVEDLLILARLDELPSVSRDPVDLSRLVNDSADDARAVAPDREVTVDVDVGEHFVLGDTHQIRQVLANLLRNGLMHTPPATPIEITLTREGAVERIEVRDHGPGLPPGSVKTIFERFWRAEGGRERGKAGAGLGLAIVAEIVDAHGGRVHASNAPDGGARFAIELPVEPVEAQQPATVGAS